MTNSWLIDFAKELSLPESELSGSSFIYSGYTTPEGYEKYVFLNTFDLTAGQLAIPFEQYGNVMHIHVNPECAVKFSISLNVTCVLENGDEKSNSFEYYYIPEIVDTYNSSYGEIEKMINDNVSYQLLRANPKLTGNVKVVVDEKSNLYLDTFKVSSALSQYKYRHIAVNPEEYYGRSLMTKFHKMSASDFYKIDDNCYNLFATVNDYGSQYYDMYNCGVRTNDDKLYPENYALLAPLCVKSVLPDFFVIFKVETDEYNRKRKSNEIRSEADKIKYFMANGTVVKSFDMRDGTNLGKYIRGIEKAAADCPGDIFVSYETNNYNKFIGISLDRGVITSAYESNFSMKNVNNQVAMNDYFTLGFERNKLVSKNIINFEFMFSDRSEDLFSINTYFGLYLRLNGEDQTFSCIGFDRENSQYVYDRTPHSFPKGFDIDAEYPEIIYGISTPYEFIRLKEPLIDSSVNEEFMLKPYKSVVSGNLSKPNLSGKGFISIRAVRRINVGEHMRFADLKKGTIYDVVFSNYGKYLDANGISEVACEYFQRDGVTFTVKTVSVYTEYASPEEYEHAVIKNQICRLFYALRKFGASDRISPYAYSDNEISVLSDNPDMIFENVSDFSNYDIDDTHSLEQYEEGSSVTVFGENALPEIILDIRPESFAESDFFFLYPSYTEGVGNRIVYACRFMEVTNDCYILDAGEIGAIDKYTILYKQTDSRYAQLAELNIRMLHDSEGVTEKAERVKHVTSFRLGKASLLSMDEPYTDATNFSLYQAFPINTGVCSILQIRDFVTDVLDRKTSLSYDNVISTNGGEFSENTAFGGPIVKTDEEIALDYIDKYRNVLDGSSMITLEGYAGFDDSGTEWLKRNDYFKRLIKNDHISSDISLTYNYLCKWKSNGTDARGSKMRVMYNYNKRGSGDESGIMVGKSYYVPYDTSLADIRRNVAPSRFREQKYDKYLGFLQSADSSYPKYISNSFDSLVDTESGEIGKTVRDALLYGNMRLDDMLYSEYDKESKFSYVYGSGNNSIEFISGGVKFRLSSENDEAIDFNTYKGYSAIFISLPGVNPVHGISTELLIDETAGQISLLWYQGKDAVSINSVSRSSEYRLFHTSPIYESKCGFEYDTSVLKTRNDGSLSQPLCDETGYLMLESNNFKKSKGYSRSKRLSLISRIPADPSILYGEDGYFITAEPYAWTDTSITAATDGIISANSEIYSNSVNAYVFSDMPKGGNPAKTLEDLLYDVNNCGIFIKKAEGCKDYTFVTNLLKIDVILPFQNIRGEREGIVQASYAEPVTRDMLSFSFNDKTLNDLFEKNMSSSNIIVSDLSMIPQLWINKYTEETNYCIPLTESNDDYRISVDTLHNVSVMDNCWTDIYRKYRVNRTEAAKEERYDIVSGYTSGYEPNTFINSRGINFDGKNGKTIVLEAWKNTKISQKGKYIKLDITESLINYIMFTDSYSKAWRYLNTSNIYKIRYIKNSILNRIDINNMTKFEVFMQPKTFSLYFRDSVMDESQVSAVSNIKNELKFENGKYYMYIYPDENHIYYAKMTITL